MEKEQFYKLVEKMREIQINNSFHKLTTDELIYQWQIEFSVDEEIDRYSKQKSKVPETPVTFAMFLTQYCAN